MSANVDVMARSFWSWQAGLGTCCHAGQHIAGIGIVLGKVVAGDEDVARVNGRRDGVTVENAERQLEQALAVALRAQTSSNRQGKARAGSTPRGPSGRRPGPTAMTWSSRPAASKASSAPTDWSSLRPMTAMRVSAAKVGSSAADEWNGLVEDDGRVEASAPRSAGSGTDDRFQSFALSLHAGLVDRAHHARLQGQQEVDLAVPVLRNPRAQRFAGQIPGPVVVAAEVGGARHGDIDGDGRDAGAVKAIHHHVRGARIYLVLDRQLHPGIDERLRVLERLLGAQLVFERPAARPRGCEPRPAARLSCTSQAKSMRDDRLAKPMR